MTIDTYNQLNAFNVRYIAQLKGLNEELNEELAAKKWRNATLLIGGANVIF